MLERTWSNWNPQALLAQMQNGAATLEDNLAVPQVVKHRVTRTSLVAQWLRIRLLGFPGGSVVKNPSANAGETQALVQEDLKCLRATKPVHHNY